MSSSLFVFRLSLSLSLIHLLLSVFISFFSFSRSAWFSFSLGFLLSLSLSLSLLLTLSLTHSLSLSPSLPFDLFYFSRSPFLLFPSRCHSRYLSLSFLSVLLFLTRCCSLFPLGFLFVLSLCLSLPFSPTGSYVFLSPFASWGLVPRGAVGVALLISLKY